jgi:hypothetical protein
MHDLPPTLDKLHCIVAPHRFVTAAFHAGSRSTFKKMTARYGVTVQNRTGA